MMSHARKTRDHTVNFHKFTLKFSMSLCILISFTIADLLRVLGNAYGLGIGMFVWSSVCVFGRTFEISKTNTNICVPRDSPSWFRHFHSRPPGRMQNNNNLKQKKNEMQIQSLKKCHTDTAIIHADIFRPTHEIWVQTDLSVVQRAEVFASVESAQGTFFEHKVHRIEATSLRFLVFGIVDPATTGSDPATRVFEDYLLRNVKRDAIQAVFQRRLGHISKPIVFFLFSRLIIVDEIKKKTL